MYDVLDGATQYKGKDRQCRQGRQGCFFPKLQRLDPRDYEMINGLAENTRVAPPNNQSKSHRVCDRTRKDVGCLWSVLNGQSDGLSYMNTYLKGVDPLHKFTYFLNRKYYHFTVTFIFKYFIITLL